MPVFPVTELNTQEIYKLLIGSVLPRPIALVSTLNADSSVNVAPFSSFNLVCSNPATISFSVARRPDGSKKDTLVNIERSSEFTVSSAHTDMLKQVAQCGAEFPYGVSESEKTQLELKESITIAVPALKKSLFQLECKLHTLLPIGDGGPGSAVLVIGTIEVFHIADSIYNEGQIDFSSVHMLSRLGGHWYATLGEMFEEKIPRPS